MGWLGSIPDDNVVLTVLIVLIFLVNYLTNILILQNERINSIEGGFMEKIILHSKFVLVSFLMTISAVLTNIVATGLTSGLSLETLKSLGLPPKVIGIYLSTNSVQTKILRTHAISQQVARRRTR